MPIGNGNLELLKVLNVFDVGIGVLTNMVNLLLSHNKLTAWPVQLENLIKLQKLDLSYNKILGTVPTTIGVHDQLSYLDLSHNTIVEVPQELYSLPLIYVDLSYNMLSDLPKYEADDPTEVAAVKLETFIHLDVSHNLISALDLRIGLFPKLQSLNVSKNKLIDVMDAPFGSLTSLTRLDLSRNKIPALPDSIGWIKAVTYANFSNNEIVKMPSSMSQLKNLKELQFSHNQLTELAGTTMVMLSQLQVLNVSHNKLRTLPVTLYQCKKLIILDLSFNDCEGFDVALGLLVDLTQLLAEGNRISTIPTSISALKQLEIASLHRNCLTTLPMELSGLTKLRALHLSHNDFEVCPEVLPKMNGLTSWDLSWSSRFKGHFIDWQAEDASYNPDTDIIPVGTLKRLAGNGWKELQKLNSNLRNSDTSPGNDEGNDEVDANVNVALSFQVLIEEALSTRKRYDYDVLKLKRDGFSMKESVNPFVRKLKSNRPLPPSVHIIQESVDAEMKRMALKLSVLIKNLKLDYSYQSTISPKIDKKIVESLRDLDLGYEYQAPIDIFLKAAHELSALELSIRKTERYNIARQIELEKREKERQRKLKELQEKRKAGMAVARQPPSGPIKGTPGSKVAFKGDVKAVASIKALGGVTAKPLSMSDENDNKNESKTDNTIADKVEAIGDSDDVQEAETNSEEKEKELTSLALGIDLDADNGAPQINKSSITDFLRLPPIFNSNRMGSSRSVVYDVAFDIYFGLGSALISKVEKYSDAIRKLEKMVDMKQSLLGIHCRTNGDLEDLVMDYYEEIKGKLSNSLETKARTAALQATKSQWDILTADLDVTNIDFDDNAGDTASPATESEGSSKKATNKDADKKKKKPKKKEKPKVEVAPVESELMPIIDEPKISKSDAKRVIDFLWYHRQNLLVLCNAVLDAASELLKMRGWDPTCPRFVPSASAIAGTTDIETDSPLLRERATRLGEIRARSLQWTMKLSAALAEYFGVIKMCKPIMPKRIKIELIKIYNALGQHLKAKDITTQLILREMPEASEERFPPIYEVVKWNEELGLLYMYADVYLNQLDMTNVRDKQQKISFNPGDDGMYTKLPSLCKSAPVGRSLFYLAGSYFDSVQKRQETGREDKEREEVRQEKKVLLANVMKKYKKILDKCKDECDNDLQKLKEKEDRVTKTKNK